MKTQNNTKEIKLQTSIFNILVRALVITEFLVTSDGLLTHLWWWPPTGCDEDGEELDTPLPLPIAAEPRDSELFVSSAVPEDRSLLGVDTELVGKFSIVLLEPELLGPGTSERLHGADDLVNALLGPASSEGSGKEEDAMGVRLEWTDAVAPEVFVVL